MRLQCYNFEVVYRSGKSNIADPLSRLCVSTGSTGTGNDNYIKLVVQEVVPQALSMNTINEMSGKDEEIMKVKQSLALGNWDESLKYFKIIKEELCFYNNILLRGTRIVIPKGLRARVLELAHEGHPGIVAMKHRLRSKVWWPGID